MASISAEVTVQTGDYLKLLRRVADFTPALEAAAEDIKNLAEQLAPKETGALSESGRVEVVGRNKVEVSFGNGLPDARAPAQEYGTSTSPAQPFLTPAAKEIDVREYVKDFLR